MTKQLEKEFKKIGSQEHIKDPIIVAKFFNPTGIGTWYATEYSPGTKVFFGYVSLFGDHNDEWGYFSLEELESVECQCGLGIERDLYFKEQPIGKIKPEAIY